MAFIHKNVNSALLTLIAFISVALVTATVYSVNAFDSINNAYVEQAIRADSLEAELAQKAAMTDALKQTAQLTQDREAALADMLAKEREATAQATVAESTVSTTAAAAKATTAKATTPKVYNPYANRYTYWPYRTTKLVI